MGAVTLYDVRYDNTFTFFTPSGAGAALLAVVPPSRPPTSAGDFLFDWRIYSHLGAPSEFPAVPESRAKETLTDVFFHPPESFRPGRRRR